MVHVWIVPGHPFRRLSFCCRTAKAGFPDSWCSRGLAQAGVRPKLEGF